MANNENAKKENLTIEEMEAKLKAIDEQRLYYNECIKQKKAAEERRKMEELKRKMEESTLAKETRRKEVDDAIKIANELLHKYIKDYGKYNFETSSDNGTIDIFWPHHLWL